MKKLVITLTGPSCSGKSTISKHLQKDFGHLYTEAVSHTTRDMRAGETDGYDYYFISDEEFDRMVTEDAFIENVQFNGKRYGGAISEFERIFSAGKIAILVCEPQGVEHIRDACNKLGWEHVAVAVEATLDTVMFRWLSRIVKEEMDETKIEKYHSRIMETITKEIHWSTLPGYNFIMENNDMKDYTDNIAFLVEFARSYKGLTDEPQTQTP